MIEVLLRECNGEAFLRYDLFEERGERENRGVERSMTTK